MKILLPNKQAEARKMVAIPTRMCQLYRQN